MSPSWCAFYEISVSAQFKCYWQRCKRFRKKLLPKEHTICYFNKTKFEEPIHRKSFLARWGTNFCNNGWMLYFLAFIYSLNNLQFVFIFVNNFLQNYNIAKKFGNESNRRIHNFLYFAALSNVCFITISPAPCPVIHLQTLVKLVARHFHWPLLL